MDNINITSLNDVEKQGLVCMFYARLPKTDPRYKNRLKDWEVLEKRFGRKVNTYKNDKDAFDSYFTSNNRVGWQDGKTLDERRPGFQHIYDTYKDIEDSVLEEAVRAIIEYYSIEADSYVSMKCGFPETVHEILGGKKHITVDGIYTLKEELTQGKIIFLTIGGDTGRATVDWKPGFVGISHIIKEPYDFGYNEKERYFKIDIEIDCLFEEVFKREDFVQYLDAYDAAYIGPELSRDPSQAISSIDVIKAIAVLRAVIDRYPELEDSLRGIFDDEILNRVKGAVRMMLPVSLEYGESKEEIIASVEDEINKDEDEETIENRIDEEAIKNAVRGGKNILYYGVPGSGKSFKIDEEIKLEAAENHTERVVFHPDYTYADLVGQISPRLKKNQQGEEKLTYEFVPGPFTKILNRAYLDPQNKYYFIIEEINRGNAPAIFGDIFQLLDRDDDGSGKYAITNFDLGRVIFSDELHEIKLPSNLSIYATMNTSDQNVFTLDTAFQRRWNMRYVKNNVNSANHANAQIVGSAITWRGFANTVNEEILKYGEELLSAEDKQLGAYFVGEKELGSEAFPEKVLKYLWDDAFKMDHERVFNPEVKSIGGLIESYSIEVQKGHDPLKFVMRADVYKRMMDMSAETTADAIDESEIFEAEPVSEEK